MVAKNGAKVVKNSTSAQYHETNDIELFDTMCTYFEA